MGTVDASSSVPTRKSDLASRANVNAAAMSGAPYFVQIVSDDIGVLFLLDRDGSVWGFSDPLKLGGLVKIKGLSDIAFIAPFFGLRRDGSVWEWKLEKKVWPAPEELYVTYSVARPVKGLAHVTMISAARGHLVAVEQGNGVKEAGAPLYRMGSPDPGKTTNTNSPIKSISTSGYSAVALTENDELIGWGLDEFGQLGTASKATVDRDNWTHVALGYPAAKVYSTPDFTIVLSQSGNLHFYGGCSATPHSPITVRSEGTFDHAAGFYGGDGNSSADALVVQDNGSLHINSIGGFAGVGSDCGNAVMPTAGLTITMTTNPKSLTTAAVIGLPGFSAYSVAATIDGQLWASNFKIMGEKLEPVSMTQLRSNQNGN